MSPKVINFEYWKYTTPALKNIYTVFLLNTIKIREKTPNLTVQNLLTSLRFTLSQLPKMNKLQHNETTLKCCVIQ